MNTTDKSNLPSAILWDWNGTLLDDLDISLEAVNLLLDQYGINHINKEQYYSYIDTPIIKFYSHLFNLEKIPFNVVGDIYHKHYNNLLPKSGLMSGAMNAIQQFKRLSIPQFIVSASHKSGIIKKAAELGIFEYMTDIIGADDYTASSKIERCASYFNALGMDTSSFVVIGDTRHDYTMARSIGAVCILTQRGHEGKEKLSPLNVSIIDSINYLEIMDYYQKNTIGK